MYHLVHQVRPVHRVNLQIHLTSLTSPTVLNILIPNIHDIPAMIDLIVPIVILADQDERNIANDLTSEDAS